MKITPFTVLLLALPLCAIADEAPAPASESAAPVAAALPSPAVAEAARASDAQMDELMSRRRVVARMQAPNLPPEPAKNLLSDNVGAAEPAIDGGHTGESARPKEPGIFERSAMSQREALKDVPLSKYIHQNADAQRAAQWKREGEPQAEMLKRRLEELEAADMLRRKEAEKMREYLLDTEVQARSSSFPEDFRDKDKPESGNLLAPAVLLASSIWNWIAE